MIDILKSIIEESKVLSISSEAEEILEKLEKPDFKQGTREIEIVHDGIHMFICLPKDVSSLKSDYLSEVIEFGKQIQNILMALTNSQFKKNPFD